MDTKWYSRVCPPQTNAAVTAGISKIVYVLGGGGSSTHQDYFHVSEIYSV